MQRIVVLVCLMFGMISLCLPLITRAQAGFGEGFDATGPTKPVCAGLANLIAAGWIFRNQSQPEGAKSWFGSEGTQAFSQYEGTGFLANGVESTQDVAGSAIGNWAILPAIPGQASGDIMRFFVQASIYTTRDDRLQVRYSPSGGTSTGPLLEPGLCADDLVAPPLEVCSGALAEQRIGRLSLNGFLPEHAHGAAAQEPERDRALPCVGAIVVTCSSELLSIQLNDRCLVERQSRRVDDQQIAEIQQRRTERRILPVQHDRPRRSGRAVGALHRQRSQVR
jgi:hypothetical protein